MAKSAFRQVIKLLSDPFERELEIVVNFDDRYVLFVFINAFFAKFTRTPVIFSLLLHHSLIVHFHVVIFPGGLYNSLVESFVVLITVFLFHFLSEFLWGTPFSVDFPRIALLRKCYLKNTFLRTGNVLAKTNKQKTCK